MPTDDDPTTPDETEATQRRRIAAYSDETDAALRALVRDRTSFALERAFGQLVTRDPPRPISSTLWDILDGVEFVDDVPR